MACKSHNTERPAQSPFTVLSGGERPECHGPSYYCARDIKGAVRGDLNANILAYWETLGAAMPRCPRTNACPEFKREGRCSLGWHGRDLVNGGDMWFPFAGMGEAGRADRVEFSHVTSADNGGAYCACGLLPEVGLLNNRRGSLNIVDMTTEGRDALAGWATYWEVNHARKASLVRLRG